MSLSVRGFRVKSNTGFHGVKYRRAGLMVAAKGGVYPFAAVTDPAYSLCRRQPRS